MSPSHRLAEDTLAPEPEYRHPDDHSDQDRPDGDRSDGDPGPRADRASAWERVPPRGPVLRWRPALLAVTVLIVAAAAWWAVAWLTSPAPPAAALPAVDAALASTGSAADPVPSAPGPSDTGPEGAAGSRATGAAGSADASASPEATDGPTVAPLLRVHVVGEVGRPGVVSLVPGARVGDAVRAAGGATRSARTERINLAAPLADGQQVLVPAATTPDEALARIAAGNVEAGQPASSGAEAGAEPADTTNAAAGAPTGRGSGAAGGKVDLNAADANQLQTLPGVGPAMAEKIIAQRERVGPFTGLQDLDAVPGVGPATLERLRDLVTW